MRAETQNENTNSFEDPDRLGNAQWELDARINGSIKSFFATGRDVAIKQLDLTNGNSVSCNVSIEINQPTICFKWEF